VDGPHPRSRAPAHALFHPFINTARWPDSASPARPQVADCSALLTGRRVLKRRSRADRHPTAKQGAAGGGPPAGGPCVRCELDSGQSRGCSRPRHDVVGVRATSVSRLNRRYVKLCSRTQPGTVRFITIEWRGMPVARAQALAATGRAAVGVGRTRCPASGARASSPLLVPGFAPRLVTRGKDTGP